MGYNKKHPELEPKISNSKKRQAKMESKKSRRQADLMLAQGKIDEFEEWEDE